MDEIKDMALEMLRKENAKLKDLLLRSLKRFEHLEGQGLVTKHLLTNDIRQAFNKEPE